MPETEYKNLKILQAQNEQLKRDITEIVTTMREMDRTNEQTRRNVEQAKCDAKVASILSITAVATTIAITAIKLLLVSE